MESRSDSRSEVKKWSQFYENLAMCLNLIMTCLICIAPSALCTTCTHVAQHCTGTDFIRSFQHNCIHAANMHT